MHSIAVIEYFCARGHVTRASFSASALFDVPSQWECEVCHELARRTPPGMQVDPLDASDVNIDRQIKEVEARRKPDEGEALLQEALRRLRGEA